MSKPFDTTIVFLKDFFEKNLGEKSVDEDKSMENYTACRVDCQQIYLLVFLFPVT